MSEEMNVFDLGADYLLEAQDALRELEANKAKLEEYKANEKKLKKSIAAEEKSIKDEIATTVKKRKSEIESSYNKQLDAIQAKKKKVQGNRDKSKGEFVSQRVSDETADLKEENRRIKKEIKTLFKEHKVPSFCMTDLYACMYEPRRVVDYIRLIILVLVMLVAAPVAVYYGLQDKPVIMIAVMVAVLLVVFGTYILVFMLTKYRHKEVLAQARELRKQMNINTKEMKKVANSIKKDKDESGYDLGEYDDRLQELEEDAKELMKEKNDALEEFEKKTQKVVIEEIEKRRQPKLTEMCDTEKQLDKDMDELEKVVKKASLEYTQKYEKYLGGNFSKAEGLADLISIMAEGNAQTVGDAIAVYKGQKQFN